MGGIANKAVTRRQWEFSCRCLTQITARPSSLFYWVTSFSISQRYGPRSNRYSLNLHNYLASKNRPSSTWMSAIEHDHAWKAGRSSIGWGIFRRTIQIRPAELSEMPEPLGWIYGRPEVVRSHQLDAHCNPMSIDTSSRAIAKGCSASNWMRPNGRSEFD